MNETRLTFNIITIKISTIQIIGLDLSQKQRINQLISELNVHFGKINKYIDEQVKGEKIDIEVIDSFVKLREIARLAQADSMSGESRLRVDLLESIIALLNTQSGSESTRTDLQSLGWDLLPQMYPFDYETLVQETLRFSWLKRNNLIRSERTPTRNYQSRSKNDNKKRYVPSEEEVDNFYKENRQKLYEYMINEMASDKSPPDPFSQSGATEFCYYHWTLSNIRKLSESVT